MNGAPALRTLGLGLALLSAVACGERSGSGGAPRELPPQLEQLLEAVGANDFDAARGSLARIDRDALPADQRALVDRIESQLYSAAGDHARALQALERALESGSLGADEQQVARFDRGWLYNALGDPARALDAYRAWQEALSGEPTNAELLQMSEAHAAARDCAAAAALIAKAYARATPEERIDVAAALEVARPLCPEESGLAKYGDLTAGS